MTEADRNRFKSGAAILEQFERVARRAYEQGRARARAAHPETNGEPLLVHNWGNESANQAWRMAEQRGRWAREARDRLYRAADHRDTHGATRGFVPLWCPLCQAGKRKRGGR
jgi:hypothetical protein